MTFRSIPFCIKKKIIFFGKHAEHTIDQPPAVIAQPGAIVVCPFCIVSDPHGKYIRTFLYRDIVLTERIVERCFLIRRRFALPDDERAGDLVVASRKFFSV